MIRKFENKDIDFVMQIWKNENIKAHNFIPNKYWEGNYDNEMVICDKNYKSINFKGGINYARKSKRY